MPRRPTSDEALHVARWFLSGFIERTDSQVHFPPLYLPSRQGYAPQQY